MHSDNAAQLLLGNAAQMYSASATQTLSYNAAQLLSDNFKCLFFHIYFADSVICRIFAFYK